MKLKRFFIFLLLLIVLPLSSYSVTFADTDIYIGGMPVGFTINTRGIYVLGLGDVLTADGLVSPSKNTDIQIGDVILKIDGVDVNTALDVENHVSDGHKKLFTLSRKGEIINEMIKPAKDTAGYYRVGLFLRDTVNGIGTVTYIKNNTLASLGHPILDDNGKILQMKSGEICKSVITSVLMGEKGKAGALCGAIYKDDVLGEVKRIAECGVYAKIDRTKINFSDLIKVEVGEAKIGEAKIFTTIDDSGIQEYSINIVKAENNVDSNKNLVIKITDKNLIEKTGGIVQGMSGSPIIQDGKLVGAVTHVFINDPLRGFGVSINNMLKY